MTHRILLAVSTSRYSRHLVKTAVSEALRIRDRRSRAERGSWLSTRAAAESGRGKRTGTTDRSTASGDTTAAWGLPVMTRP